ncbi:uncharacterized protein LOC113960331 [Corapipo altera]|uniref:uncharacterized protein LOC113960331 n=1 Tax=Corapipo altera TaxID=415028 RepID=UPI000FD67E0D|nr:uncharacterized protein LOC113960331 [Corapipo altera]
MASAEQNVMFPSAGTGGGSAGPSLGRAALYWDNWERPGRPWGSSVGSPPSSVSPSPLRAAWPPLSLSEAPTEPPHPPPPLFGVIGIGCQEKPLCSRDSLAFVLAVGQPALSWDCRRAGGHRQPRSLSGAVCSMVFTIYGPFQQIPGWEGQRGLGRDPQWLERGDRVSRVCGRELGWKRHFLRLFVCRELLGTAPSCKTRDCGTGMAPGKPPLVPRPGFPGLEAPGWFLNHSSGLGVEGKVCRAWLEAGNTQFCGIAWIQRFDTRLESSRSNWESSWGRSSLRIPQKSPFFAVLSPAEACAPPV